MTIHPGSYCIIIRPFRNPMVFLLIAVLLLILPALSAANPDVYKVLPGDTRILQYNLADFDGDAREELAVLYTTAKETRLTLFRGDSGRWTRWWDDRGGISLPDGGAPRSLETVDTNGDGRAEMLVYYLTEKSTTMAARILTLDNRDPANPVFNVILEDVTSPPGYPLVGMEGQSFSVTFMKMATRKNNGYRRVYCWNQKRFEKCVEVVWEKP
jgi:hypothetical protein